MDPITREDVLERAAGLMELGVPPIQSVISAYNKEMGQTYESSSIKSEPLPVELAYELNISPTISYGLTNQWRRLRKKGDYLILGSILDDFIHRGANGQVCARYLLAFLAADSLDRFPERLLEQIENADLVPLPSRTSDLDRVVFLRVVPEESGPFDPDQDLDEDPEEFLYDDQGA